jgi:hypothetical protein
MNPKDALKNLLTYAQVLFNDGDLYWLGNDLISTPERKNILIANLKSAKQQIEILDQLLTSQEVLPILSHEQA